MSRGAVVAAVEDHQKLTEEIEQTERQIFDLEQFYLSETSRYGNVLRGWRRDSEGGLVLTTQWDSLTSAPSVHTETSAEALVAHENVMTSKQRLFSLSSTTSPAQVEFVSEREQRDEKSRKNARERV